MKKQYSIRFLLLAALAAAFSLVLVLAVLYNARAQSDHLEECTHRYVDGLAKSYFDGLNTMMLTGTMANREMLRQKFAAPGDVLGVRLIRGGHVKQVFGNGLAEEKQRGAMDERSSLG